MSRTSPIIDNHNLTEPEKEILRWHQKLGHISIKRVQWLMKQGMLSATEGARRGMQADPWTHVYSLPVCQTEEEVQGAWKDIKARRTC